VSVSPILHYIRAAAATTTTAAALE